LFFVFVCANSILAPHFPHFIFLNNIKQKKYNKFMVKMRGLKEACAFIRGKDGFVLVGHHDADGLTATGIIGLLFDRLGKQYKTHNTKQLDRQRIADIAKLGERFVFVDCGSGQIDVLAELLGGEFCIIDHHKPHTAPRVPHFNPHLSGIDGSTEISGAGAAYLVAREIDQQNKDLSKLAIVGAVGDMQDSVGHLIGKNREILKDGMDAGEIIAKKDIRFFGRNSRPLTQFLSYSSDPFLPGLTANEENCVGFLEDLNIKLYKERWRYYVDLNDEEKKRLISALYVYGKRAGVPEYILRGLIGEVYEFPHEPERTVLRDAKEFATLLNACGRHGETEIGVKVCMGDRDKYLKKAETLLQKHRKMLRDGIEWAQKNGVTTMNNIYVLDGGDEIKDTLIGVIAGMLYGAQVIKHDKPVIALAIDDDGMLKASGRATLGLVRRGLDLGKGMREACVDVGGEGGGHNIAAGARLLPRYRQEFLDELDRIVGKQIKK
jgi:single-stranded-DNA-specific exonuclease